MKIEVDREALERWHKCLSSVFDPETRAEIDAILNQPAPADDCMKRWRDRIGEIITTSGKPWSCFPDTAKEIDAILNPPAPDDDWATKAAGSYREGGSCGMSNSFAGCGWDVEKIAAHFRAAAPDDDLRKGEAMDSARINELARECAESEYEMMIVPQDNPLAMDERRERFIAKRAPAIAQALRTVAREVLEDAELAARLNEAWQAEMRRHLSLSGHTVYRGVRQAGEVFLRTEAAKYEEQSDG